MQKNTLQVQKYFNSNPGTDTLYFTGDGLAFKQESNANAHRVNLSKGKTPSLATVTPVTRAEAFEGGDLTQAATGTTAAPALTPLQIAQNADAAAKKNVETTKANLDQAQLNLDTANNAKNDGASATGAAKTALTKAVTKATKELADATAAYNDAVTDADTARDALAALMSAAK